MAGSLATRYFSCACSVLYRGWNLDQARPAKFRSALATDPADVVVLRADAVFALNTGSIDQAEHDLRKIIDLQVKAPDDAAWWRRLLATLLASSGDRRKVLECLKLVGLADEAATYVPAGDEPVDEIRARAKVLGFRKNRDGAAAIGHFNI